MEIETDTLINEVEKRLAICNMAAPEYSNRTLNRRAWEELASVYCNPVDSDEKKK